MLHLTARDSHGRLHTQGRGLARHDLAVAESCACLITLREPQKIRAGAIRGDSLFDHAGILSKGARR